MIISIKGHLLYGKKDQQEKRRKDGEIEGRCEKREGKAKEKQRGGDEETKAKEKKRVQRRG